MSLMWFYQHCIHDKNLYYCITQLNIGDILEILRIESTYNPCEGRFVEIYSSLLPIATNLWGVILLRTNLLLKHLRAHESSINNYASVQFHLLISPSFKIFLRPKFTLNPRIYSPSLQSHLQLFFISIQEKPPCIDSTCNQIITLIFNHVSLTQFFPLYFILTKKKSFFI